jgi:predicted nucleic acid-binding protein
VIVVDASVIVELLTDEGSSSARVSEALGRNPEWIVPEHLVIDVASALRGLWLAGRVTDAEFDACLAALSRLEFSSFPTVPLLPRIRSLAANATAYDAAYLALAEHVAAPLLTLDHKLARVKGSVAQVRVIDDR